MSKDESGLKRRLIKSLPPQYFAIAHSDIRKYGIPDLSISGHGRTSWWELKHATPRFATTEIQEITCERLAKFSFCRYVIYFERNAERYTYIIHPSAIRGCRGSMESVSVEEKYTGFNHVAVANYIQQVHQ